VSQSNSAVATSAIDTSNYRKHTHGNPIQRKLIDRFHQVILAKIADLSPQTFLDAGCGEGFVADLLLRKMPGLELTGFDFNPDAVEIARAKNPTATFITASIFDLPYDDSSFDVVGCFEVLEHLPDPRLALKELTRVARNAVIISVPHEPFFCYSNVARGKNLDIRPRGSDPDHKNFWSRKAFGEFVGTELDVVTLTGSFPWTICVGKKPDS
jgi:2-polyprenyl-3-methyl-5-hydroxy-6-metoxy-1,4-benzoquinol methylase